MKSRLGLSKENAIFQAMELMDKYGKALSQKLNKNILYSYYEQYDIRTSGYVPNVKECMDMIRIGKSDLEEHRVFFKNVVDDTDYARMILNIYHEGQHAIQFLCVQLDELGYPCDIKKSSDIIDVIEKYHIDTSKLTFTEGSYAAFKDAIHNGAYARFDEDYDDMFITDEERKFMDAEIAAGRLFRIR